MRVVSAIINDIYTDQRVRKQAGVLKSLDCNVTIVCRRQTASEDDIEDQFKSVKFSFPVNKGPLFYFLYNLRLFIYLLFHRFDLYIANDLDTIIPCFLIAKMRRKPFVYDAHEYFTGQYGLSPDKLPYKTWKRIEHQILPHVRHMITVSDSISQLYFSEYRIMPVVVRNLSYSSDNILPLSRSDFSIPEDIFLVILQGSGLNPGRGVTELLDALKITNRVHLLIVGSGDSMDEIKAQASDPSLTEKVTFIPKIPWNEMISYTKMCDAGLSLDKDISINQRFSLPNKIFDYLSAGIPVITSSLPEINRIVEQYNCGLVIKDVTPTDISKALICMRDDFELRAEFRCGAKKASHELTWDNERQKEYEFFKEIINPLKA